MNIKIGILNVPKHGNKHDLIHFVTINTVNRIQYSSCYSITQNLLQFLDELGFSDLFLVVFDRHPQLVCERVMKLKYVCHVQKEHVLPSLL